MNNRLFKSPIDDLTYAYQTDGSQDELIANAIASNWRELTQEEIDRDHPSIPPYIEPVGVEAVRQKQANVIELLCGVAIVSGFSSDALSPGNTYPSKKTDQANLQAETTLAMISSGDATWTTLLSVQASDGTWSKKAHTAAQVIKVSQDFSKFRNAQIAKKDDYLVEITAADTVEEVFAVVWN